MDEGMWGYDGPPEAPKEWDSLETGLRHVLDHLWPYREKIGKYAGIAECLWWCGHFQSSFDGGPRLSPDLLRKLGEFGVALYIDNYYSSSEDVSTPA
jgi:hypothetical protein